MSFFDRIKRWFLTPIATPMAINSFTPIKGRITIYGYKGDSTPDTNSLNAIGAWDNKLVPDISVALSPDAEAAVRAAGVLPKGRVDVQLASGTILNLVWADRTANDKQAAHLGLKPLRGRFDLFTPSGHSNFKDQAVTGIRKA